MEFRYDVINLKITNLEELRKFEGEKALVKINKYEEEIPSFIGGCTDKHVYIRYDIDQVISRAKGVEVKQNVFGEGLLVEYVKIV